MGIDGTLQEVVNSLNGVVNMLFQASMAIQ